MTSASRDTCPGGLAISQTDVDNLLVSNALQCSDKVQALSAALAAVSRPHKATMVHHELELAGTK
ncbi:hypothetical protein [Caproicibacterium lactatifermentans]|uniref:hypothetical protein n=1 Tax=Caproicibacterium lactatifermentans TaxID=2666138 RepID=UPI000A28EAAD|nr:hypothetical protein [Caproicibacterium lactatifermentans]ARP50459.1 hypothetical protein B6259_05935 [Ruminococcaceae bacterium CPB6]